MIFIKNNLNKKEKRQFEIFNALNKDYCKDFYYFDGKKRISIYRNEKLIYSLFNKGNLLIVFDHKFTGVILAFKYDKYYELKCLASILKSIILGVKWEEALKYVTPFGKIDLSTCKSLVEGKNVKNVLQLIQEKLLVRELEKTMKEIEDPSKQTQKLELVITKHAFTKIWEKLLQLKGRDKLCIKLVGINVDMLNIMTVLRLKKLELKPEEIEAYIIPVYHLLNEKDVKRAISATTEKDSIKVFVASRYVDVISPLTGAYEVREDLSVFEIALKRYHAR